ncbi:MAG: hypothetical protein O7D91_16340 [Planctomycetota bacterium]|nr:hypothetical protein [Planctomycetota bacterium]
MVFRPESMLLRRVLQANAVFSTISGIALVAAAGQLAALMGVGRSWILLAIGAVLLVFAVTLLVNSLRENIKENEVVQAIISDGVWVAASIVIVFMGIVSTAGIWMVAIVACLVLSFAILQAAGLRKLRRAVSRPSPSPA